MTLAARYTTVLGPGDTSAQQHASSSLGLYASKTVWGGGVQYDLFGLASSLDITSNRPDYRCLFVYNPDATTLTGVRVFLDQITPGGVLAVGADPRPVSRVDALSPQAVEASSGYAVPSGVTFTTPLNYGTAIDLGTIAPGFGKAFWVRRTPTASARAASESCDIILQHATGTEWTKTVLWASEPATIIAATAPPAPTDPFVFTPTPSPFLRVGADFLSSEGARVMWDLDATLRDPGPYDFQLQMSQSGGANSADWVDVGPVTRDAPFLIDEGARLWGMSATTHYRVILTTAANSYLSPAANVYGSLKYRDWLNVREIVRKEQLHQREFVGADGFLLKAKRYGTRCTCKNPTTGERGNSSCVTCYGVGIVGGYHAPVATTFATLDPEKTLEHVQYNENLGTTRPTTVAGRVIATLPLVHEDVWISASGSGECYYVWSVTEAATVQSVPVVYIVELRLAARSDIIYTFPVARNANPTRYWRGPETLIL